MSLHTKIIRRVFALLVLLGIVAGIWFGGSALVGLAPGDFREGLHYPNGEDIVVVDDAFPPGTKVAIVTFWTKSCSYCMKQLVSLQSLADLDLPEEISIITVNVRDSDNTVEKMQKEMPGVLFLAGAPTPPATGVPHTFLLYYNPDTLTWDAIQEWAGYVGATELAGRSEKLLGLLLAAEAGELGTEEVEDETE